MVIYVIHSHQLPFYLICGGAPHQIQPHFCLIPTKMPRNFFPSPLGVHLPAAPTGTWTLKVAQHNSEMSCLLQIEGVTRRDRVRNEEICNRMKLSQDVCCSPVQQRCLRYLGQVCRMGKDRYPKLALDGYNHGRRERGRSKKRWIDCESRVIMGVTISCSGQDTRRRSIEELPLRAVRALKSGQVSRSCQS